jgi:hypothetical protein
LVGPVLDVDLSVANLHRLRRAGESEWKTWAHALGLVERGVLRVDRLCSASDITLQLSEPGSGVDP